MIDIHCHILPELDDGAKDMDVAIEMCKLSAADGIETTVCSAHANSRYKFDPNVVQRKIEEVMARSGGRPKLVPGCDFHLSYENIQSALAEPRRYTINHGSYLLVEFADFAIPPNIDKIFFDFRSKGMIPIVTHPERNPWLMRGRAQIYQWVEVGALVQVTAGSLLGRFGQAAQRFCYWALEHRIIHFVATDAHNVTTRPPMLRAAYTRVAEDYGHGLAEQIFKEQPQCAVEDRQFVPEPPVQPKKRTFFDALTSAFRR